MNIEMQLETAHGDKYIQEAVGLLGESSTELLAACADGLDSVVRWLELNNTERFKKVISFFSGIASPLKTKRASTSGNDMEKNEKNAQQKEHLCVFEAMDIIKKVLEKFKAIDR